MSLIFGYIFCSARNFGGFALSCPLKTTNIYTVLRTGILPDPSFSWTNLSGLLVAMDPLLDAFYHVGEIKVSHIVFRQRTLEAILTDWPTTALFSRYREV